MTPAIARRVPASLSVLTALVALTLSSPLALVGAPGHATPLADEPSSQFKITSDVIINKDDTYSAKVVIVDNTNIGFLSEDNCSSEMFAGQEVSKNAKTTFKEEGDSRTCTIEGSQNIKDSKGQIKHEGREYIVRIGSDEYPSSMSQVDVSQTITFPGKVTEADGGQADGNKVTFTDLDAHTVKGGDGAIPMWVWILGVMGVLALIGGGAAAFFITRNRKNQGQPAYGAPAGYNPDQALPTQPDQPAGYGNSPAQPGQPPYGGGQPGQSSY